MSKYPVSPHYPVEVPPEVSGTESLSYSRENESVVFSLGTDSHTVSRKDSRQNGIHFMDESHMSFVEETSFFEWCSWLERAMDQHDGYALLRTLVSQVKRGLRIEQQVKEEFSSRGELPLAAYEHSALLDHAIRQAQFFLGDFSPAMTSDELSALIKDYACPEDHTPYKFQISPVNRFVRFEDELPSLLFDPIHTAYSVTMPFRLHMPSGRFRQQLRHYARNAESRKK
ncbi:hypothetical protein GF342_00015 [Candidatus Woesearchaeota archaeon]|nr:hypothetical protein [Candidatus Woesearchaeota archaeon]